MPIPDLPFYRQSKTLNVVRLSSERVISANQGYYRIRFVDMRLGRDWVATSLLAPALHIIFESASRPVISGEAVIGATPSPNTRDARRTYIAPQSLTPTIPYFGTEIDLRLGLCSVPIRDLAAEMLDLLGVLASTSANPEVIAMLGLADVLRNGINALFGLNGSQLLVGWQGKLGGTSTLRQDYIVVTPPGYPLDVNRLVLQEGRLRLDAKPLDHVNYIVFAVEVAYHRNDWRLLPEIKPFFDAWNHARSTYDLPADAYNRCVSNLLGALRSSSNIVSADAERILVEEIAPLLQLGKEVESTLYRQFGIDPRVLDTLTGTKPELSSQFVQIDVVGAKPA